MPQAIVRSTVAVVQRHLEALVGVLVVHVVHAVERVDVGLGQPVHHRVELGARRRRSRARRRRPAARSGATCLPVISSRPPLIAYSSVLARLTRAPKNCICLPTRIADTQQAIAASSPHGARIRSSDSYWIADGVDRDLRAEPLEARRAARSLQNTVRFGSGAGPRLYRVCRIPERRPGDQRAAVLAHAADRLGHPGRVAGEQLVVLRGAQEPHDAQLDHQVVDQLLRLRLGEHARVEVALQVDVEERRRAAQRHRRAVLLLHRAQVGEVQPLHGLAARSPAGPEMS